MFLAQKVPTQSSHTTLQQLRQLLFLPLLLPFRRALPPGGGTAGTLVDMHRAHLLEQNKQTKQESGSIRATVLQISLGEAPLTMANCCTRQPKAENVLMSSALSN